GTCHSTFFLHFYLGASLGWIIVKITKPPEHLKGIVVANCCSGNLGNLLFIVIPAMCQEKGSPFGEPKACKVYGTAYASFSMALGSIFIWTYAYSLVRSASHIQEENEIESGIEGKIPNIDYLNAGEKSSLLQTVQIVPEVPSSGGNSLTRPRSGSSIIGVSSLPKDFNQEVGMSNLIPFMLWTTKWHCFPLLRSQACFRDLFGKVLRYTEETRQLILEELKAPPTVGVIAGFLVGAIPQAKALIVDESSPLRVIQDSVSLVGDAAIPSIILILGGNLVQGLRSSSLRSVIVILVICVRFVLLPVIGIFVVKGASYLGALPEDPLYHFVMMLQFTVPPAMNI
ncbi:hypothetical protein KI387_024927, partial [Taxus chinensis]